jgi:hypothetical protein
MEYSEKQSDFYAVKSKYLAMAMAFLGFSFQKYNDSELILYSFRRTKEFEKALSLQLDLKKQFCDR